MTAIDPEAPAEPLALMILNGDQMEYELENQGVPPKERSDWPQPSFDARDWAEAFCKKFPQVDEGTALAWFAGALMRGYDEHARRAATAKAEGRS